MSDIAHQTNANDKSTLSVDMCGTYFCVESSSFVDPDLRIEVGETVCYEKLNSKCFISSDYNSHIVIKEEDGGKMQNVKLHLSNKKYCATHCCRVVPLDGVKKICETNILDSLSDEDSLIYLIKNLPIYSIFLASPISFDTPGEYTTYYSYVRGKYKSPKIPFGTIIVE